MGSSSPLSVTAAMRARVSTRAFLKDQPIPRAVVEELLETACRAPSGGNTQPWHLYILAGEEREALVRALRQPGATTGTGGVEYQVYPSKDEAPPTFADRRRRVAYEMWALMGVDRKDAVGRAKALAQNWDFFGAPVGIIVTVDRACDHVAPA